MNNIYGSANEVVDQVGQIYFSGNIIPTTWYKPTEMRDEQPGKLIGFKKRLRDDLLQRSYQQISDQFGMSKREATNAVVFLEKLGVSNRKKISHN